MLCIGFEYCNGRGHECCVSGLNIVMAGDMNVVCRVVYCKEQGHECCVSGLNIVMAGDKNVVYRV